MKSKRPLLYLPVVLTAAVSISNAAIGLGYAAPYTQNSDSLASSDSSTRMPADWVFSESGTAANTSSATGTGSATGDVLAIDNFPINAIPEPAAAFLGTIGLLSLLRRRRI